MVYDHWVLPWTKKGSFPQQLEFEFTKGILGHENLMITQVVAKFMTEYSIPGISIAIAQNGRLVYAKGFGYAKKPPGIEALGVFNRFRIASISKPITAVAIMTLIEQGHLALTTGVFGSGNIFGTDYGFSTLSPENQNLLSQITIQHLLEHTSGGWPNDLMDPMMIMTDLNQEKLITWTLQNRPLTHSPGTVFAYSNFGYCLLGRVIERLSKRMYAEFVQESVLGRCGITTMAIAGDNLAERGSDEVIYYGGYQQVEYKIAGQTSFAAFYDDPYFIPVSRMDAHGGWIASAIDLVRFAVHVDDFPQPPDILNATSMQTMITPTTVADSKGELPNYARGWARFQSSSENNWFHTGRLAGLTSVLLRSSGGFCWAALANTRHPGHEEPMEHDLDRLMWRFSVDIPAVPPSVNPSGSVLVGGPKFVSNWPTHDLFQVYDDPWSILTISSV